MGKQNVVIVPGRKVKETGNLTPESAVVHTVLELPTDYSKLSLEELLEAIGKAYTATDVKLMGVLSKLYTKKDAEAEAAKKAALQAGLAATTSKTSAKLYVVVNDMIEAGELDGAEGIWFSFDFGAVVSEGVNPALKLTKSTKKVASDKTPSKSSYVANDAKSIDVLKQVGNHVYLSEDTEVIIDKVTQTVPAGMTFQEAYDYSQNGGWRNKVRMALLKEAGII